MILAFVVQLSAAIAGFTLISKSESIARHTLDRFIYTYDFFQPSAISMDFIQKSVIIFLEIQSHTKPTDVGFFSHF